MKNGKLVTLAVTAVAVCAIVGAFMLATPTSAYIFPKNVRGWVWDNMGNPVPDIPVTIEMLNKTTHLPTATVTATTNSQGFYSKSFLAGAAWEPGDTLHVIATYGGDQEDNSTVATSAPLQFVNVTFPYEIPEFGMGWLGIVAAGAAIVAVGVALFVYLKRK